MVGGVCWVLFSAVLLSLGCGFCPPILTSRGSPCLKNCWSCSGPLPWRICAAAKASPSPISNVLAVILSVVWTMVGSLVGLVMGQPLTPPGAGAPPAGDACGLGVELPNVSAFRVAPLPLRRSASGMSCANRQWTPNLHSPSI
jgi:hypothetical protein